MMVRAATAAALVALAFGASAQEDVTYSEQLEDGALEDLSQVEQQMARLLRANRVSEGCIGQLSFSDAGAIYQIVESDETAGNQRDRVEEILIETCGEDWKEVE